MAEYTSYSLGFNSDGFDSAVSVGRNSIADEYDSNKTYSLTDFVIYDGDLYQCITAVSAPEAWKSAKWERRKIFDNFKTNDTCTIMNGGTCDIDPVQEDEELTLFSIYNKSQNESVITIE